MLVLPETTSSTTRTHCPSSKSTDDLSRMLMAPSVRSRGHASRRRPTPDACVFQRARPLLAKAEPPHTHPANIVTTTSDLVRILWIR
jgi:hypothetical protein